MPHFLATHKSNNEVLKNKLDWNPQFLLSYTIRKRLSAVSNMGDIYARFAKKDGWIFATHSLTNFIFCPPLLLTTYQICYMALIAISKNKWITLFCLCQNSSTVYITLRMVSTSHARDQNTCCIQISFLKVDLLILTFV